VDANTDSLPRTGSLIIAGLAVTIIQKGTDITQRFADVPPENGFFDYITLMAVNGITSGCATNPPRYCPNDPVTRGQMAVFIIRALLGEIPDDPRDPFFDDVRRTHPFFKYVQKMKELGITNGCSENPSLYCPDDNVTRGQMAVFIVRGKLSQGFSFAHNPYFTDVPSSDGFFGYIQKMKETGVTSGCALDPPLYCPNSNVTRGQMAAFIIRALLTPGI
jgi:hypothetical protein